MRWVKQKLSILHVEIKKDENEEESVESSSIGNSSISINGIGDESTEAIFGDDSDSDDSNLRGVSNVVYRKE